MVVVTIPAIYLPLAHGTHYFEHAIVHTYTYAVAIPVHLGSVKGGFGGDGDDRPAELCIHTYHMYVLV